MYRLAIVAQYAAAAGITTLATIANRDAFYAISSNRSKLVYVNNNNGSANDAANGIYEYVDGAPRTAVSFYEGLASVVQPLVDQAVVARDEAQDWAEGDGEPGGEGTKSAKGWAASIANNGGGGVESVDSMIGQVNIFDKSKVSLESIIPNGSALRSEPGYYATDFMPVSPAGKVVFNSGGVNFSGFGIQFYDTARNFLSFTGSPQVGVAVDVPAKAAWIRTSFPNSVKSATIMAVHGSTLPSFREFGFLTLDRAEARIAELRDSPPINLLRPARIAIGSKYNDNDGVTVENVAGWYRTDFMACRGGVPVYVSPGNNLNQGFFAYDENKQLLVKYDPAFYVGASTFTPPLGAYYWRLHGFTARLPEMQYVTNGAPPVSAAAAIPAMLSDVAGQWSGMVWAHQGDSLDDNTDSNANGYQWVERAAGFHGMSTRNFALGGRLSSAALRRKNGALLTTDDFAGVAVSSIKLGTNDALQGVAIGDMSDALNAGTFIANIRNWLATTYGWNKAMRQVLCTPPKLSNANVDPYADAIRAIAQREGVPLLDFHRVSGVGPLSYADKLTDGTHIGGAFRPGALGNPAIGFFKTCLPTSAIGS